MTNDVIIETLQEWNLWSGKSNPGIARDAYVSRLLSFVKTGKVASVVGVRRSGKSTLLRQMAARLIAEGIPAASTLLVNFEEPAFENMDLKGLSTIYKAYREIVHREGKPFIFLDEVQNVAGWERFVRGLQEKDAAHIVVTGSSSKLLSSELGSVLTGRQLYLEVLPLSFGEYLMFRGVHVSGRRDIALQADLLRRHFREYCSVGGFPEAVLTGEEDIRQRLLLSYYEDIINRDVVGRFKVRSVSQLKTMMNYFMTNVSNHMSFNRISGFIHLPVETVRRFSHYGEASELVFFVNRHSFSVKAQENSTRKVYAIDHGLRDRIAMKTSTDFGRKAENIAALHLRGRRASEPGLEIRYWKNLKGNKEADFVVSDRGKPGEVIQVCWDMSSPDTRKRELGSLVRALEETGASRGIVLGEGEEAELKENGRDVLVIPLWKWLLL